jgi:hypothetical protein
MIFLQQTYGQMSRFTHLRIRVSEWQIPPRLLTAVAHDSPPRRPTKLKLVDLCALTVKKRRVRQPTLGKGTTEL